jgi:hypothetical protein
MRKITLDIDCGPETCDGCACVEVWRDYGTGGHVASNISRVCRVFHADLDGPARLPACLAAEHGDAAIRAALCDLIHAVETANMPPDDHVARALSRAVAALGGRVEGGPAESLRKPSAGEGDVKLAANCGWARVEDGRPPEGQQVLCYRDSGTAWLLTFRGGRWMQFGSRENLIIVGVTHWRPLPPPPVTTTP